jgi:hypothetical protein
MREMKKLGKSQTEDVLRYMKENGSISSKEAFEEFGATRLSAIIFALRKRGYEIETEIWTCTNRYGKNVDFAKYILKEEP